MRVRSNGRFGFAFGATPASGKVKVSFKLSKKSLKALARAKGVSFKVTVKPGARSFTTKLKLKPPK